MRGAKHSNIHSYHVSLAEAGKVKALSGQHQEALKHYREAIKTAVSAGSPEVFFRHYTHCVLESLELSGSYDEVISFCKEADEHYSKLPISNPIIRRDHGSTLERWGLVLAKSGQLDDAKQKLELAIEKAKPGRLPISEQVHNWLVRGYHPDISRIERAQKKHNYFTVRRGQVDPTKAVFLEPSQSPSPAPLLG